MALLLLIGGDISSNPGPVSKNLKISTANVRSARNKIPAIESFLRDHDIDCLLLNETWITEVDCQEPGIPKACFTPDGYTFVHTARTAIQKGNIKSGGGVGVLARKAFDQKLITSGNFNSFEHCTVSVDFVSAKFNLVSLYRPPDTSIPEFYTDFQQLLSFLTSLGPSFIVSGDFNLHVDDPANVQPFLDILENYNLKQHVDFSTHINGHILDLFITPDTQNFITKVDNTDFLSDHSSVTATLNISNPLPTQTRTITYRNYKKIDMVEFKSQLQKSALITEPKTNASDLYNQYHTVISELVDRHAPLITRSCPARPPDPWITPELIDEKRKKRRLERVWRNTKSDVDKKLFQNQVHKFNNLISTAKSQFFTKLVGENKDNPKKLWSKLNSILHRTKTSVLPNCSDTLNLANSFGTFFQDKIAKLRTVFNTQQHGSTNTQKPDYTPPILGSFAELTEEEVKKLVLASPSKSCSLDPCPTDLVKDCLDILITPISKIINLSIREGCFPDKFKIAHVTPLLKKPTLDKNNFKNYRPVSNLNFLSKLTEKAVANQIKAHINTFKLDNPFQSAYKAFHSTETALLSVQNDIYAAMGRGELTALTLLDLSAAFDTIDHHILLDRLRDWFGLCGNALDWIASYLKNRFQSVCIENIKSNPIELIFGVPQGSVLGPLLFIMYTTPLSSVLNSSSKINHHLYADDTQAFTSFIANKFDSSICTLKK